jgi:hypothetical protein
MLLARKGSHDSTGRVAMTAAYLTALEISELRLPDKICRICMAMWISRLA